MCPFRRCALAVFLVLGHDVVVADDSKRPDPPEGFQWQELEEIDGAVLLPDGWHFGKSSSKDGLVYRVTKEKLDEDNKVFLTGLTINVLKDVKEKTNVPPSIYVVKYLKDYKEKSETSGRLKVSKNGNLLRITGYFDRKIPDVDDKTLFRVRVTTIANDDTGTMYVAIFGTPKDEWEQNYELGKQMFNPLMLSRRI